MYLCYFITFCISVLTQNGHIWPWAASAAPNGLNIGWTWFNIVFHVWGWSVGTFWVSRKWPWGGPKGPKVTNLGQNIATLAISGSSCLKLVEHGSNWVEHCISDLGWSVGPFCPHENVPGGPQKPPKFCRLAIGSPSHPNQVEHGWTLYLTSWGVRWVLFAPPEMSQGCPRSIQKCKFFTWNSQI